MSQTQVDSPGEIHWFADERPFPVLGPCPHGCRHMGTGVLAWGPSTDRYELVECGSRDFDVPGECNGRCRAWVNDRREVVTRWLMVDLTG